MPSRLIIMNMIIFGLLSFTTFFFQNCGQKLSSEQINQFSTTQTPLEPQGLCYFNGSIVNEGAVVEAYLNSVADSMGQCLHETRICHQGVLTGSFQFSKCNTKGSLKSCLFNSRQIEHGESVVGYLSSVASSGGSCSSKVMVCDDGILAGSDTYSFPDCNEAGPQKCQFNGITLESGKSIFAYKTSSVSYDKNCEGKTLTCVDGQLPSSDTFKFTTCSKQVARSCLFNGSPLAHEQSVFGFKESTVEQGQLCEKKLLTCVDGQIDGSVEFPFAGCAVKTQKDCQFDGIVVEHGKSITGFKPDKVQFGTKCESTTLVCSDGILTGAAGYTRRKCEWLSARPLPSVEDFGAKGDGLTDDTAAFESAALVGGVISLKTNKSYKITRRVILSKPTTIFGLENTKIILIQNGSLAVHSSDTTIENLTFDGSGMSASVCAVTLLNDHSGWQRNIVIRNLSGYSLPCFVGDDRAPAQISKTNTYVDVYISNLISQNARGPQVKLRSVWAFLFIRDISISMSEPANGAIFSVGPNEGSLLSGIHITGTTRPNQDNGIHISQSAAVFLSDSSIQQVGGDGIISNDNRYSYWRNLTLKNNKGFGYRAANVYDFLKSNIVSLDNNLGPQSHTNVNSISESTSWAQVPEIPAELKSVWNASLNQVDNYAWVTDFGAKGNGINDDSDAFQAAVNSGVHIYIPPGEYKLTKTIYIEKPVRILGKLGVTFINSTANHGFHLLTSDVILSGFRIVMSSRATDIAVYLNSYSKELKGIFIQELESLNAGFTVTNISTGQFPVSVNMRKVRSWYPRNSSFLFIKLKNSIMNQIFGEYIGIPSVINYPFMYFLDSHNNSFNEGTVLGYGSSAAHNPSATSVIVSQSSNFFINRWQGDVNNGHGLAIEKSEKIYLSDIVFTPVSAGSIPLIIDQSKFVYGTNFLFTQPPDAQYSMSITNNSDVNIAGFLNLGGKPITKSNNINSSLPPY